MTLIGELSLWVALLMAAWSMTVSFAGALEHRRELVDSGERALYAASVCTILASIGLWSAFYARDLSFAYVALHITTNLPTVLLFSAFWAGAAGGMLLFALMLTMVAVLTLRMSRSERGDAPWITGTLAAACVAVLGVTCFAFNPYARLDWIPPDGRGLEPQLQHLARAWHTPLLSLGLAATVVPFAHAIDVLISGQLKPASVRAIRRWTLMSWCVMTLAVTLGLWCAYNERGGSDNWALDPVRNGSILPWLSSAALLHVGALREARGMLGRCTLALAIATFPLAMLVVFVSGEQDRVGFLTGPWTVSALVLGAGATAAGFIAFGHSTKWASDDGRLPHGFSREGVLAGSALICVAFAVATLIATLLARAPMAASSVTPLAAASAGAGAGAHTPFRASWYDAVATTLGALWMLASFVAPLVAWRRGSVRAMRAQLVVPVIVSVAITTAVWTLGPHRVSVLLTSCAAGLVFGAMVQDIRAGIHARQRMFGESLVIALARRVTRDRRRHGLYVIHIGVLVVGVAFAGLRASSAIQATPTVGDAITATDPFGNKWTMTSQGVSRFAQPNGNVVAVTFRAMRDGKPMGLLLGAQRQYVDGRGEPVFDPWAEVGALRSPTQDVLLRFVGSVDAERTRVEVRFNPCAWFVWCGGVIMAFGSLIMLWPKPSRSSAAR